LNVRLTACSGKNIVTKSKEAMAGLSEIRQPMKLGEINWRNAARNRDSWQKLLKKALAQKGLLCQMMMMMMMMMITATSLVYKSSFIRKEMLNNFTRPLYLLSN